MARPTFSPSPALSLAGSLALAVLVAAGFHRVLRRPDYLPDRPAAIRLVLLGLALDAVWAWMFFAGRHPTVALAVAAALAVTSASAALHAAAVDRLASVLLLPWGMAASFLFLLDLSVALRNG